MGWREDFTQTVRLNVRAHFSLDDSPSLQKEDMAKTKSSPTTSTELLQQSDALRRQAEDLKRKEIPGVVARMKEAIAFYGLTARDLGLAAAGSPKVESTKPAKKKSAKKGRQGKQPGTIKYRDAAGNAWTGVGRKPNWFVAALAAGATPESLRVETSTAT